MQILNFFLALKPLFYMKSVILILVYSAVLGASYFYLDYLQIQSLKITFDLRKFCKNRVFVLKFNLIFLQIHFFHRLL